MYTPMPLIQIMYVHHLPKAVNTEVESNSLKSTIKAESNHLWVLFDKQWCLLSGPAGINWMEAVA